MKTRQTGTVAILLLLGISAASDAEYLIYLKGGHFIVAEECVFGTRQKVGKGPEAGKQPSGFDELTTRFAEDCMKGSPEGQVVWSTVSGHLGEVDADNIYAIFGTQGLPSLKSASTTQPLEDYLITNRGGSFVNAKAVEERGAEVLGLKRDQLTRIDRRGIVEIAPESVAKSRSGEGLCPGEAVEFSVSETEIVSDRFVGVVTNLSQSPWEPWFDVEVWVKGRRLGKFPVKDPNVLSPDDHTAIDYPVPDRFLKELERLNDAEAGVRLCYRKVKTATKGSTAEKPPTMQSPR